MKKIFYLYVVKLFKHAGSKALISISVLIFLGFMEGIGIFMLVPLLQFAGLTGVEKEAEGIFGIIFLFFKNTNIPITLPFVLSFYIIIVSLHSILKKIQTVVNAKIGQEFDFRQKAVSSFLTRFRKNCCFIDSRTCENCCQMLETGSDSDLTVIYKYPGYVFKQMIYGDTRCFVFSIQNQDKKDL